jgi:hypothetical protein
MPAFKLLAASRPDLSMLTVESAESTGSWSLRRQPRKAHHLAPHCGFLGGEGCGLGWRAGEETPRPARLEPLLKWSEFKRLDLPVICIDAGHARAVLKTRPRSGKAQSNQARDQAAQSSSQSERGRTGWSAAMAGLLVSWPIPWAGVSSCLTSAARRGDTGSAIASYSTRSRRPIASIHAL